MNDDERPQLLERARAGDWDAIEDLVSGTIAPTFDAALHLLGDPASAARATEDALFALLSAVKSGEHRNGDPLIVTARSLAKAAASAGSSPFPGGLLPDDLVAIGRRPDDARRAELGKVPGEQRMTAVLAFALDLEPSEMAAALGRPAAGIEEAVRAVLAAIPHDEPEAAFRDVLDSRASRVAVPLDVEERVLDRFEASLR